MNKPQQKSERTLGVICILCSAFCFSLMSVFVRLAGDVPVMQKIFFRNLVAALAAFAILARESRLSHSQGLSRRASLAQRHRYDRYGGKLLGH